MKKKIALITGVTGQDGSHLIDFLIKKNYLVIGTKRKSSTFNTARIDHIYDNKDYSKNFIAVYADMTDSMSLLNVIKRFKPQVFSYGKFLRENPRATKEEKLKALKKFLDSTR